MKRGFYEMKLRRIGDVFVLTTPEHFSTQWMVGVGDDEAERVYSAQELVDQVGVERYGHAGAPVMVRDAPAAEAAMREEFDDEAERPDE